MTVGRRRGLRRRGIEHGRPQGRVGPILERDRHLLGRAVDGDVAEELVARRRGEGCSARPAAL